MEKRIMNKKNYEKPVMEVNEMLYQPQLMADSITRVESKGLDSEEEIEYGDEETKVKSVWDDAW